MLRGKPKANTPPKQFSAPDDSSLKKRQNGTPRRILIALLFLCVGILRNPTRWMSPPKQNEAPQWATPQASTNSRNIQEDVSNSIINNITSTYMPPLLPYRNILFVHVGKAGGETLKRSLSAGCLRVGRRQACLNQVPDTVLNKYVTEYFHVEKFEPSEAIIRAADAFLFILRHPIDRTISWFRFVDPANCISKQKTRPACKSAEYAKNPDSFAAKFFLQCFPTIQDFAANAGFNTTSCQSMASSTLRGESRNESDHEVTAQHMIWNTERYAKRTASIHAQVPILVVRTESLWDDVKALDRSLGGTGDFGSKDGSRETHGVASATANSDIPVQKLCCALQSEMLAYQDLVGRAVNLDTDATAATLQYAAERCGASSWDKYLSGCAVETA